MKVQIELIALTWAGIEIGIYQVLAENPLEYLEKVFTSYLNSLDEVPDEFNSYLEYIQELNIKKLNIQELHI